MACGLRDLRARAKDLARIDRLIDGNPDDVKPVGADVSELLINYGPGYPSSRFPRPKPKRSLRHLPLSYYSS